MTEETGFDGVDLEKMWQTTIDMDAEKATLESALPPRGTYWTVPDEYPINIFPSTWNEKNVQGEETGKTRNVMKVTGIVKGKENTRIEFFMSHEKRQGKEYSDGQWTGNYTQKPDMPSRLFSQACAFYESKMGKGPRTVQELVDFLLSTPFPVNLYHSRKGEVQVGAISAGR